LSSSSELAVAGARVLRAEQAAQVDTLSTPELRSGTWTRFGGGSGLGDPVTEAVLSDLAETTRAAARAQGYSTGWAEGRREAAAEAAAQRAELELLHREAEARREAEHQQAVAALVRAAGLLQQQVAAASAEVEDHALELARELTEALVAHELASAADPVADVVRRALAVLPQGLPVTVRLSPAVAGDPALQALRDQGITVVADPSLERHDALVESTEEAVDLRVSAALARVREVLA
jgi:flagellar assembly protein FliH